MAREKKRIKLALQGGGALGAFTWGALDRLLEDDRVEIAAISGASAGAMNAVVLADGYAEGGAEGARAALRKFWEGVAEAGRASPYRRTPLMALMSAFAPGWSAAYSAWTDAVTSMVSPYNSNPLNINPLKELVAELVNFERVRGCAQIRLFISATDVETGRIALFENAALTPDHVMASACLPTLFQAVEIGGRRYWDGGYVGNPALFPLFEGDPQDIVLVRLIPLSRPEPPTQAREIVARLNEITFNASLMRELHAIAFVGRLLDEGRLESPRYKKILMHEIADDAALSHFGAGADLNADWSFFQELFALGRAGAETWLKAHWRAVGQRSSVDISRMYL